MDRSVWIINHYTPYPGEPGASRHASLARHLRDLDWDVTLIASSVPYVDPSRQRLERREWSRLETIEGQRYLWAKVPTYTGRVGRLANMLTFTANTLRPGVTRGLPAPDAVVGSTVHLLTGLAALRQARQHRVPFLFEIGDLWPMTLIDRKAISATGPAARGMATLERYLYRHADEIVTLLPGAGEHIEQAGVASERIHWIPNGVDCDHPTEQQGPPSRDLMYLGSHGISNDLDLIINGFGDFKASHPESDLRLRLIGDGPLKPEMQELARRRAIPDISFEDPIPKEQVPQRAAEALAFAFAMRSLDVYRFGISPNKVFEYMAAAKPVLMSTVTTYCPILASGGGISITDNTVRGWAAAIAELDQLPQSELDRMGRLGRAHVEHHYDYRLLAARLSDVMAEAIQRNAKSGRSQATPR